MLKKILVGMVILGNILFAQVNDNLNLFKEQDKTLINEKIEKFQDATGIKVYVNTLIPDEGFEIENPEKAIILNFRQKENNIINVEVKFTQDLNMEEKDEEMNVLLNNLEEFINKKDYGDYTVEFLDGTQELLSENITLKEQEAHEKENNFFKYGIIGIIVFIVLTILIIISKIKRRKK